RWLLHARLAEALVNAGRGGEAASEFITAAKELAAIAPGDLEVLHLRRCAAEHYLRSGYLDGGGNGIRCVLSSVRLRSSVPPRRALFSLIVNRFRLGLRNPRSRSKRGLPLRPLDRARIDACWSAGLGLSLVDSIRAFTFQVRHALLVFPGGD